MKSKRLIEAELVAAVHKTGEEGKMTPHIRRVKMSDRESLARLDHCASLIPWTPEDWHRETTAHGAGILVACESKTFAALIVGFAVFQLQETDLELRRLVTRPFYQSMGVGSCLLEKFGEVAEIANVAKKAIGEPLIDTLACLVPERLVSMQCVMRKNGYKCTRTLSNFDDGEARYLFEKRVAAESAETK